MTVSTAAAVVPMVSPDPLGMDIDVGPSLVGVLNVTSFPGGGTGTTLWVNFQTSYDEGLTWGDVVQVNVNSTGIWYFPFSTISNTSQAWQLDGTTYSNAGQALLN